MVIAAEDRLDRALAAALGEPAGLSRSAIARLIAGGGVTTPGDQTVAEPGRRVKPGERYRIALPPPVPDEPQGEAIPLAILFEDDDLIVIDKPAGMVVHPAPGASRGTLVNALRAHCGTCLAPTDSTARPGIVHRLDKDSSGILVAAKSEAAREGLAAQFAAHSVERRYLAVTGGAPAPEDPRLSALPGIAREPGAVIRIDAAIARHPVERTRMAVRAGGRHAVTRIRPLEHFGDGARPAACLIECRLETGRTHQIRVHAAHIGHALIGDPVYRRGPPPGLAALDTAGMRALTEFPRQALHAAHLGFVHPVTGAALAFDSALPEDMAELVQTLRRITATLRTTG